MHIRCQVGDNGPNTAKLPFCSGGFSLKRRRVRVLDTGCKSIAGCCHIRSAEELLSPKSNGNPESHLCQDLWVLRSLTLISIPAPPESLWPITSPELPNRHQHCLAPICKCLLEDGFASSARSTPISNDSRDSEHREYIQSWK